MDIQQFFEQVRGQYTDAIARCVPRYGEMLAMLLEYIPRELQPRRILELGCGSGNLTLLLAKAYPDTPLTAVDLSPGMLAECRARLAHRAGVEYLESDFRELDFDAEQFDLVASSISLHHLDATERSELFARIHGWLAPGGWFAFSDQMSGSTPEIYDRHLLAWRQAAHCQGTTEREWADWMQHQQAHDHHAPLAAHFDWLQAAGFRQIDCPWRYLLWTVVVAARQ